LGNIHDLDVLAEMLKRPARKQSGDDQDWETRIEAERQKNVQTFRQMALARRVSGTRAGRVSAR